MLDALPQAHTLLGNRGNDADRLRKALAERSISRMTPTLIGPRSSAQ